MKKIIPAIILLFCFNSLLISQKVGFEWAERHIINSTSGKVRAKTILVDPNNNVYTFGPHASSNNATFTNGDMVLAKFNPQGIRVWYKQFPTETYAGAGHFKMFWDANYNIVVGGEMNTIFGTDSMHKYTSTITPTFGIVKLDSSGNYIWSTQVDADVDDEFDFIQMPNGDFALRGEGTVTYKPDSVISLSSNDFIAFIDGSLGQVITAKAAAYNPSTGNLGTAKRKIFSNGNNLFSLHKTSKYPSGYPFPVTCIVGTEIAWQTGAKISETDIFYSGINTPYDYQYDSVNDIAYIFAEVSASQIILNFSDTINSAIATEVLIAYDLVGDSVLHYLELEDAPTFSEFSYQHGLHIVVDFLDSTKNITLDSTYYPLPNSVLNQKQSLFISFNQDLSYNYYTQYATGTGTLFLYDIDWDSQGEVYGTTHSGNQFFFDTILIGAPGPGDERGCIFKIDNVTSSSTTINELEFYDYLLYPNPTTEEINIKANKLSAKAYIEIYNTNGSLVKKAPYNATISLKDIEKGTYLIRLVDDKKFFEPKLIVKN